MSFQAGNAYITITPSMRGFQRSVARGIENSQLDGPASAVGAKVGQSVSRSAGAAVNFQAMGRKMQDFGRGMSDIGGQMARRITLPALGAAAAVGGITAALGWRRLTSIDSAQAQLRGLGYEADDVERISGSLVDALEGGMMTLGDATSAAAGAMAAGVKEGDELTHYIQMLDAAVVGGNGTFEEMNQIFSRTADLGYLNANNFDMMAQRMPGFSSAMQEHTGKSGEAFREMLNNGEISLDEFLTVMDDFGGDMATEYANSWEGMVENTKNWVGIIGAALLSGVFEDSKLAIAEFIEFLSSEDVSAWATEMGVTIGNAFQSVIGWVQSAIEWWTSLDGSTQRLIGAIAGIVVALGPVLVAIGTAITVFGKLVGTLGYLASPITWVVAGIAALTAGLIYFFTQTEAGQHVWGQLTDAARAAAGWFQDSVLPVLQDIGAYIADTLVPAVLDFAENALTTMWEMAKTAGEYFQENILPVLMDVGSYVKDTLIPNVVDFAQGALADMVDAAKDVGDYIQNTLIPAFQDFGDWVVDNEGKIKGVATVIGVILLPAMARIVIGWVSMGIAAVVSGIQTAAVWLMYRVEAIRSAAVYAVNSIRIVALWVLLGLAAIKSGLQTAAVWLMYRIEAIKSAVLYVAQSWRIIGTWVAMGAAAVLSGLQTAAVWLMYKLEAVKAAAVYVAQRAVIVGSWVAMSAAAVISGARTALVWAVQVVGAAVAGAASFVISAGRVVGGWVLMSIQSLLHAGRMAAAWFIALGPIGWVTAAIIAIAALVIANWDKIAYWTQKIWTAIVDWVVGAWHSIRERTTALLTAIVNWITLRFQILEAFVRKIWRDIRELIVAAWQAIRDRTREILTGIVTWVTGKFNDLLDTTSRIWTDFKNTIVDAWTNVRDSITDIWENGIKKPLSDFGSYVKNDVPQMVRDGVDMIDKAWRKVANFFRTPINSVIDFVWNDGIKSMFDSVAKAVNSDTRLAAIPRIPAFADGGLHKGGWALVGEEGPELINTSSPGRVYTADQTRAALGTDVPEGEHVHPMGGAWSWVKDKVASAFSWVRGALASTAERFIKPFTDGISGYAAEFGPMGKLGGGLVNWGVDEVLDWIRGEDTVESAGGHEYDGPMQMGGAYRPGRGPITSWYGMRGGRLHGGVDIAGPRGAPTFAAWDGVVHSIQNYAQGSGLSVNLSHGGGKYSHYGHNDYGGIPVRAGQSVKAGQRIGNMGMTGRTTGPHVHFETWQGGLWNRRNPNHLFRDKGGLLPPGVSSVLNNTGGNEFIFNQKQFDDLNKMAASTVSRGANGDTFIQNVHNMGSPYQDGADFKRHVSRARRAVSV